MSNVPKATEKISMWTIRAGEKGAAHELVVSRGRIVLSDPGLGDLSKLERTEDAFYAAYRRCRPNETVRGSVCIAKGKFFRFVHEMKVGDVVLYLSTREKHVYVGDVKSGYIFDKSFSATYPHQREVDWKHVFPKTELSESARRGLGAARTFYRYKRDADEIRSVIAEHRATPFDIWTRAV